jgi:large subunit ribosomal protein L7Ae
MAKSSKEISDKALEAVRLARQSGTVRKGVNEVTKSVERGLASLVVMAEDVDPQEILMHIPKLCDQKKITYSYVPTKMDLGKAVGINVPCSAVSIEKPGESEATIKSITGMTTGKSEPKPESEKRAAPAKEQKEKKAPPAPAQAAPK